MRKEFEEIKNANASIRTTDIKGKEYAEVNERVKAFRMVHPLGLIETTIISLENGIVTMQAKVSTAEGQLLATGYAQEKESSSFINKTSYIENCETSAVGRALGLCGFGIDTSICSAEELKNAINNQNKEDDKKEVALATKQQLETIAKLVSDASKVCEYYKVKKLEDLTYAQAQQVIVTKARDKANA